jgi:hypothetical protein
VRATLERIARAGWPVLAGLLLGLAAGAVWTLVQPVRHRAEARVLVRGAEANRIVPAVQALAESSLVEQNVAQTLHLSHLPHVHAKAGKGGVLTLAVEAGSPDRARQIDAEATVVLTQKIAQRFGETHVQATVLDPAHPVRQTSPTPARNLLLCGLIGLALGTATALALVWRRQAPLLTGAVDPGLERRLKARIDAVTTRERALARRAGELAQREKQLDRREEELAAAAARPTPSTPPPRPPEPEREPEPVPVEAAAPAPPAVAAGRGSWNLEALEHVVRAQENPDPARYEEWTTYLYFLRDHADSDGTLPATFDSLVGDVFGDLIEARPDATSPG